jgi:hypothetical protein
VFALFDPAVANQQPSRQKAKKFENRKEKEKKKRKKRN